MRVHKLKTWPEQYQPICDGVKKAEIRFNDRGFSVGDWLELQEWDPETKRYTGRGRLVQVMHILNDPRFGLKPGYVCLSIK